MPSLFEPHRCHRRHSNSLNSPPATQLASVGLPQHISPAVPTHSSWSASLSAERFASGPYSHISYIRAPLPHLTIPSLSCSSSIRATPTQVHLTLRIPSLNLPRSLSHTPANPHPNPFLPLFLTMPSPTTLAQSTPAGSAKGKHLSSVVQYFMIQPILTSLSGSSRDQQPVTNTTSQGQPSGGQQSVVSPMMQKYLEQGKTDSSKVWYPGSN